MGKGGSVTVPGSEELPLGGKLPEPDDEGAQPGPGIVTVTVTSATLTVVVAQEVTVEAGHCDAVFVESVSPPVVMVLVAVPEPEVEELDVGAEVLVGELGIVVALGTPHSSRLWPYFHHPLA